MVWAVEAAILATSSFFTVCFATGLPALVAEVAAFVAGVAFELRAIRKLTVDIDNDEEPQAEDLVEEEVAEEAVEA